MRFYRHCDCVTLGEAGHATGEYTSGEAPAEIEYDYACVVCGVTVPMCEGGTIWDSAVCYVEKNESHIGCCGACATRLDRQYGDLGMIEAVGVLYNVEVVLQGRNFVMFRWADGSWVRKPRKAAT